MATFLSRREAQEKKRLEAKRKREEKLYYSDLIWLAKREWITDKELHDLYKLAPIYSNWGPRRMQHELGEIERLREFFGRHQVGENAPEMNALEKHIALYKQKQENDANQKSKKLVYAHPDLKKIAN